MHLNICFQAPLERKDYKYYVHEVGIDLREHDDQAVHEYTMG